MAARKKTDTPAEESPVEQVADPCPACWPGGWPHLAESASCEHGQYTRQVPEPEPPAPVKQVQGPVQQTPPADDPTITEES